MDGDSSGVLIRFRLILLAEWNARSPRKECLNHDAILCCPGRPDGDHLGWHEADRAAADEDGMYGLCSIRKLSGRSVGSHVDFTHEPATRSSCNV